MSDQTKPGPGKGSSVSDPDDFAPYAVEESPEDVTKARRALIKETGINQPPWPYELELYRKAGKTPPSN